LTLAFNIQSAKASGTVYIRADGSIDPPTVPIQRDGNIYTLTDDLNKTSVIIQRSNMILDGADKTIFGPGGGWESGDGIVLSANNITIRNITVTETRLGIKLSSSTSYGNITECNVQESWIGIWLADTYGNVVSENRIDVAQFGIYLVNSSSNDITLNNITTGLELVESSSYNKIVGNNIGTLSLDPNGGPFSVNNSIYHNRVGDVEVGPWSPQIWDDGYPSGGNLWVGIYGYHGFDFHSGPYQNETGSDGIGDTPYVMDENNIDHYPLMTPYVIPEFPSFLILPIFFTVTLLAVIVYGRKHLYSAER
jgi:parallel beta-helix repeat protein